MQLSAVGFAMQSRCFSPQCWCTFIGGWTSTLPHCALLPFASYARAFGRYHRALSCSEKVLFCNLFPCCLHADQNANSLTWDMARDTCIGYSAPGAPSSLASIRNFNEYKWVVENYCGGLGNPATPIWIGLYNPTVWPGHISNCGSGACANINNWQWANGADPTYMRTNVETIWYRKGNGHSHNGSSMIARVFSLRCAATRIVSDAQSCRVVRRRV